MGVENNLFKTRRFWLSSGLIVFVAFTSYSFVNRFARQIVNFYRPKLEKRISRRFGHPLKIGEYKGLRPWGISIGESEFLNGINDNSTASVSGIKIQFAPLASIVSGKPVAIVTPHNARLILRANANNPLWVFGRTTSSPLPKFDLKLRLLDSPVVVLDESGLNISVYSDLNIKLTEKKVAGVLKLDLLDKGKIKIRGNTFWDKVNLNGYAHLDNFNLNTFNSFFRKKSKSICSCPTHELIFIFWVNIFRKDFHYLIFISGISNFCSLFN